MATKKMVFSLGGRTDAGKSVKYTPCSADLHAEDELEDIAVVSNADPGQVTYGSGPITANGPRVVPGKNKDVYLEHL